MDFLVAVTQNNLERARELLQSGVDVNSSVLWNAKDTFSPVIPPDIVAQPHLLQQLQSDQVYQTKPLNVAVLGGHPDMVRLLLSAGADINSKDERGRTALICAIYGLDLDAANINTTNLPLISQTHPSHLEMMKSILLRHPNLHVSTLDSPQYEIKGITPLCLASYLGKADIIQLLLDDGRVNVDGADSKQATALMYASRDGNVPIVKMLLSYHASPDATDNHGWSAIQYAERSPDIVQACEESLRCRRPDVALLHPPTSAKYPIHYTKLSALIATLPSYPSSLSHIQFDVMRDIDLLDPNALPLIQIIQNAFLQAIKTHDHLSLQALLLWTPPIHKEDRPSSGPLLINHHDPKTGMTFLHHAMRTKPVPSLDTLAMLYQAGADINAQTYYGRTALHHLARFGLDADGKTWGIQKAAKPDNKPRTEELSSQAKQTHRLSVQSALSSRSDNSDQSRDPDGRSEKIVATATLPQHLALCASLLIRLGALVTIADVNGNTALHFATEFGGVPEVLKVLVLEGHADFSVKNKKGFTPLDLCKTEDIKRQLQILEQERKKSLKTTSTTSIGGSIRPLETASDRSSLHRSPSRSTLQSVQEAWPVSSFLGSCSASEVASPAKVSEVDDEFDKILHTFFRYQTTFTDSIERALAYITDTILGAWQSPQENHASANEVEKTTVRLRFELREAHEMFERTDERAERIMLHYRETLEAIEQTHQVDWDISEQQHDKIEKLFDVFDRIDRRFYQLELDHDALISHIEQLRKALVRHRPQHTIGPIQDISANGLQTLKIIESIPMDPTIFMREDRSRLCSDVSGMVRSLMEAIHRDPGDHTQISQEIDKRWKEVERILSLPGNISPPALTKSHGERQRVVRVYGNQNHTSLNHLELTFDILASNLHEIQKDMDALNAQQEAMVISKQRMYDRCLELEHAILNTPRNSDPSNKQTKEVLQAELDQVLACTQALFDQQQIMNSEGRQLKAEKIQLKSEFEAVQADLRKVRPPILLQGLLERLETDEGVPVQIEKDWKEDSALIKVAETKEEDEIEESGIIKLDTIQSVQAAQCLMTRLDASLYCLKIVASHHLSKSRQRLVEVQATLGQASAELETNRTQMRALYDDAADVARQVFALKTELETIVQHRKDEIIKVWEVVDEVSEGIDASLHQPNRLPPQQKQDTKERVEEQDRHQWIIRELEQLQHVHQDLQDTMADLSREQAEIGQALRQCEIERVEPQVDALVGQHDQSLLTISDRLTDLMAYVREGQLGLQHCISLESKPVQRTSATILPYRASRYLPDPRRLSVAMNTPNKKRLSTLSVSSMSSLSSYQQERMLTRASNLSQALSQTQRKRTVG
ncbi:ankyrin repeat-containing domain protein [Phycomyces blakesleeanus]